MKSFRYLVSSTVSVFLLFSVAPNALATSFAVPSDRELIEKADAIVRGFVVASRVAEPQPGLIETVYEIAVTRGLKGSAEEGSFITVRSPGGNAGGRFLLVESAAHFAPNEEVLLFLTSDGRNWTPTDMTLGAFRPAFTTQGTSVLLRDGEDIAGWTRGGRPHVEKVRLEAGFIRFIEDTVRGHERPAAYEAEAAEVVAPASEAADAGWQVATNVAFPAATYSSQFVDCADTRLAGRWPTAVMSAGVPWLRNEANPLDGAGDGGAGAIESGLAAWRSDAGSAVNVAFAGTGSGLAADDGQNMIVFNDPQDLITGTWSGSGVIAVTYLYGAGTHEFDGEPFLNIVGADIVFQDGYTDRERSLEEAMTHEIGHAIGLRHSDRHYDRDCASGEGCAISCSVQACDPTVENCSASAIMSPKVIDTLGFVLQGWDLAAAKALYPATLAAPLPPTNVLALASTTTAVFVSWSGSDGATSYTVWRSEGGGIYTSLGPPAPPAATSFLDETAGVNSTYLYKVQAHNASGSSALSGADIANTVVYTDPTLTAGMPIRAVHLTELRAAANMMQALTGAPLVPTYTDPTIVAGTTIAKAVHLQEVEAVLIGARISLGLSVPSALGIVAGSVIPAAHVIALRTYSQ